MRIGTLGHAGLWVETRDQRLLIDPVFAEELADGALRYSPGRVLDLAKMPAPTGLVLTHAHFDHYHPDSLTRLPRDLPVLVPEDRALVEGLHDLGFSNLTTCPPWRAVEIGDARITATPSGHEEPEMGIVVAADGAVFWHMADAEVTRPDGARVHREHGRMDVVSAKYQPVVRASMGFQRTRGARFDKREVVQWLETACLTDPRMVFPYASGLAFAGRHEWFNRYAFPLSDDEAVDLLRRRLGPDRAARMRPGDAIDAAGGAPPRHVEQALPFVKAVESPPVAWEPVDLSTLAGLDRQADRDWLEERLDRLLAGPVARWFDAELGLVGGLWRSLREQGVVWQLFVETGGGGRLARHMDFGATPLEVGRGRHPRASSFTHVSGRALFEVLSGAASGLVFWLTGDARSYEKTFVVEHGRLVAPPVPAPEDELGDPLTYFLRRFGPDGEGVVSRGPVAPAATVEPSDLEVLLRQGETRAVVVKKALLSFLAERDLDRSGGTIPEDEVNKTAEAFRLRFGHSSPEIASSWRREVGLSEAGYQAVMRRFTAVRLVGERYAAEVEALVDDHAKVAAARRGE